MSAFLHMRDCVHTVQKIVYAKNMLAFGLLLQQA